MRSTRRGVLRFGAAAIAAAASPGRAQAPAWPTRPLRIIVPSAPGNSPDLVARLLGNKLTERLGQPVVVESIPQGIGVLANQTVAKAAPDGHTFAMLTGGFTAQAAVIRTLPFDPLRDFAFATTVVAYPMLYAVLPNSPIRDFADLIARARAAPGKVSYGTSAGGSVYHLLGKWVENRAGVDMLLVPYRGSVPAFTDLAGGRVDCVLDTATSAIPRIRNGQLRPLAVSSGGRYPLLPDTPSIAETVPGVETMSWLGLAAPAQTPRRIIDRLNAEIRLALDQPDVKQWLADGAVVAAPSSPEEFRQRVETEIAIWSKIVDANGIKPE
jgi:tripartite-type tricarboxylate transporter receptor subunit TctC